MSMPTEAVEALHQATEALKIAHEHRDGWLSTFDTPGAPELDSAMLKVTRGEAEAIFTQRIAAHEARINELGWKRVIVAKGETVAAADKAREDSIAKPEETKS